MKTSWFYEIVKNWNEKLQWNNNELGQITRILKEISSLNGGRIAWDIDQDESIERFWNSARSHKNGTRCARLG